LASRTQARWVLLGESHHGTVEEPQAATDLLCAMIRAGRPVSVAIEHAASEQPMLDAYMVSDGGAAARQALFKAWNWDPRYADGKSSVAMLRFIDWLRVQHQLGKVKSVIAFDAAEAQDSADRNMRMAVTLRAMDPGKGEIVLALTGGYHVLKRVAYEHGDIVRSPAFLLPQNRTVSILIKGGGGTAWACQEQGCHVYAIGPARKTRRGLTMTPTPDGKYDGVLELGAPETASLPANNNP
jgi:hypothetical protein